MPSISSKSSIDALVQRVEASGTALGAKADALSGIITQVASALGAMRGKASVGLEFEGKNLSFSRQPEWGLWLIDDDCGIDQNGERVSEDLRSVSITRKARAFPLLLQLLPLIEAEQKHQLSEIETALSLLRKGSDALRCGEMEGK